MTNHTVVIVPCYNEESSIYELLLRTLPFADRIIVVNDGSNDQTLSKIPDDPKITIIDRNVNRGKGFSLNEGFRQANEHKAGIVITLDGDLQHPPEHIPNLIKAIEHADIVIGRRKKAGSDMPLYRRLSNFLTSFMINLRTGYKLNDSQSGFRVYRLEKILPILPKSDGYESETEILISASKRGLVVTEVEIPTIYTGQPSKMNYSNAILGFLRVLFKSYK